MGKTKLTYSIIENLGFEQLDWGWVKYIDEPTTVLRLTHSNGMFYPDIEQSAELSGEQDQIVSLLAISTLEELELLWLALTHKNLLK